MVAELLFEQPEAVADLIAFLGEHGVPAEDWSSSVRMLCKACSEGRPHDAHDHELPPTAAGHHYLGMALVMAGLLAVDGRIFGLVRRPG